MPEQSSPVTITQKRYQCRHIHAEGHQCGSPALRNEQFCYHHHTTRRPRPAAGKFRHLDAQEPFELPVVEDLPSALSVAAQILCRIASNDLDPTRAGKLLYNLQILSSIIGRISRVTPKQEPTPKPDPVEELVADEIHGLIAPITEYVPASGTPSVPGRVESAPPPPERDYTPEERDYFRHTVFALGYEPHSRHPRPASITDEDIQAHTNAKRRAGRLSPLLPRKDVEGRLISLHEWGARYTIPAIAPGPATDSSHPTTISTLQAAVHQRRGLGRKMRRLAMRKRKIRANLQPSA